MSDYIAHAEAEAAAYEKKRKKQLEDERKRLQAEAEAAHTAERDTAHAALKQATQTRRAAVDTAAVKAALTKKQVRETLARQGLTGSGTEAARLKGADYAESKAAVAASRAYDSTAHTATAKRLQEDADIDRALAEDVASETAKAETEIGKKRESLTKAAYSAASREEAARIKAAAAKEKAEVTDARKQAEKDRKSALAALYRGKVLNAELYARALEQGYSVEEALASRGRYLSLNTLISQSERLAGTMDFESLMRLVAPYQLTDSEWDEFCRRTGIPRVKVDRWIGGFNAWMEEDPTVSAILADVFGKGDAR